MEIPVTDHLETIVAEYLRRLDHSAASLPYDRRVELVEEIREHIEAARAAGAVTGEASLRDLLDRLGDPEDIATAAREDDEGGYPGYSPGPPPPPGFGGTYQAPMHYRTPGIGLEVAAIGLMTIGSVVPFFGWLVGTILLWTSRRLRLGEKLLMTLVVPGGPLLLIPLAVLVGGRVCTTSATSDSAGTSVQDQTTTCSGFAFPVWLGIPLLIVVLVGPFVIGGLLLKRAAERARLEPPIPVVAPIRGASPWGPLEVAAVLLLSVGGFVIPFAPIAGLVCAWLSNAWTTAEKWVATAIAVGLWVAVAAALLTY